eukprot:TRINITY_DN2386_c0_g2_i2.p1 TRINITY_DN2386_c0_g2~~TRINITY_DN2386_c0_g2_i2.p1  ORF type:complete len:193 (+),score=22.81 TRINITY_DN2386_c0_g2_i2:153-731(+)
MSVELQNEYPERREYLYQLLDVDPNWRMHELSDGQRRRVQLLLGLIRPFSLLVLDEITVDLDVVPRQDFLNFLKRETEERGACVVYATHIFDGLQDWATHLAYISHGSLTRFHSMADLPELEQYSNRTSPLMHMIADWLRADRETMKKKIAAEKQQEEEKKQAESNQQMSVQKQRDAKNNGWGPGRFYSYYS